MIKRVFGIAFVRYVLVFVLLFGLMVSAFLLIPSNEIYAANTPGSAGCDITGGQGTELYNKSNAYEGWSEVLTRARNTSISDSSYKEVVYAKPGDNVEWNHCYFPGLQKMAATVVTTNHEAMHITSFSSNPGISPGETKILTLDNRTLASLSTNELGSHYTIIDTSNGVLSLNDGPYQWAPNYSRVMNLAQYYGGMGIFGGQHKFDSGDATIRHSTNGWRVGDKNAYWGKVIDWHVGGGYKEYQTLKFNNHAKITTVENTYKTWRCSWTHDVEAPGDSWKSLPRCIKGYGTSPKNYCEGPGGNEVSASNKIICEDYIGGHWKTKYVEDTTKPIKIDGPCLVSQTDWYNCKHNNDYNDFEHNNQGTYYSEAEVRIPFNYKLTPTIDISESVVYAGESATLKDAKVRIEARYNPVTEGTYATAVPYAEMKVITYIATDASGNNVVPGTRNEKSDTYNAGTSGYALTSSSDSIPFSVGAVNVQDTYAGNYFCATLMVYPTDSGSYTNISDTNGNGSWGSSGNVCKPIAKRPSFQVWGGSLFANGTIDAIRTQKNNLLGVSSYSVTGSTGAYVFGPWSELGVMILGANTSLASSSVLGGSNGKYETNPKDGLCDYESVLTFANNDTQGSTICNDIVHDLNGWFGGGTKVSVDKKRLIDDMITHDGSNTIEFPPDETNSVGIVVGQPRTYASYLTANKKLVRYSYSKNANITIGASTITKGSINEVLEDESISEEEVGTTYIIHSDKTVTIGGNILFESGTSKSFDELSKVVIYAENINILCQVKTVDAILIAENEIKTCTDWTGKVPNVNDVSRSIPLRINGAVIADKISFDRTFGASAGPNREEDGIEKGSGVPAEVINYDTTLLLWGRAQADTSASGKVNETFTRELAPRY